MSLASWRMLQSEHLNIRASKRVAAFIGVNFQEIVDNIFETIK